LDVDIKSAVPLSVVPRIRLRGITKRYGSLVANDKVDLDIARGGIHAIVGENGAGKTTLMRIIYGMVQPDEGTYELDGVFVRLASPAEAIRHGIGMVHQRFELVDELSALENLVLGQAPRHYGIGFDRAAALRRAQDLAEQLGTNLAWNQPVSTLTVGNRQRLEIMRLLYRDADLLIFDEPTSVLTPQEADDLFVIMRQLAQQGKTIIFITHKLREVFAVADMVTVMRHGRVVATSPTSATDTRTLSVQMVGEQLEPPIKRQHRPACQPALEVRNLSVTDDLGRIAVRDVSFLVRSGEIVGLAGVEGNGQRELIQSLVGLRSPLHGFIYLQGRYLNTLNVRDRRRLGLAYISEDRDTEGACLTASLAENLMAVRYNRPPLSQHGQLRWRSIKHFARQILERFGVLGGTPETQAANLSGGNLQRLVVGREMHEVPAMLVAAHPTRGVDVRGTIFIHKQILAARDVGAGILLVSEELSELTALCDRLLVIFNGQIVADLPTDEATPERLGPLMTGVAA
jgi:ABC-type uncharacterized transport system ATPase subunit